MGSHILDSLRRHGIDTVLLLRSNSPTAFLEPHLKHVEVRRGSVTDSTSLMKAAAGVTHVIHCAGRTKAVRSSDFYEVNEAGTRNVVQAVNAQDPPIQRLLHISSLAVSGPATPDKPATEQALPNPISTYGKSKLAGELEVTERCQVPFTILRPPAVYGLRDTGFLSMFKAVKCHLLPRPKRNQFLSLVYAKDLAEAVVACLDHAKTAGQIYFVASTEQVTSRGIADEIAAQMHRRTIPCPIPPPVLWSVCLVQEVISRITGKPGLLNLQKFTELRACGWVCDGSKLQRDIGFECKTRLRQGIPETLNWYTSQGWL